MKYSFLLATKEFQRFQVVWHVVLSSGFQIEATGTKNQGFQLRTTCLDLVQNSNGHGLRDVVVMIIKSSDHQFLHVISA